MNLTQRTFHAKQLSLACYCFTHTVSASNGLGKTFYFSLLQKMYSDFALQGLEDEKLNSKVYQTIVNRIQMEEAAACVTETPREDEYE